MGERPELPKGNEGPESADAAWLLSQDSGPERASKPGREGASDPVDGYDLEGGEWRDEESQPAVPPPVPIPTRPAQGSKKPRPEPKPERVPAVVDEVWSRGAEWGPDLIRVGAVLIGSAILMFLLFSVGAYALAFLAVLAGFALAVALCYPVFITLERPIRMTPERAAKDYYEALSHYMPHYRRMWLLLSATGRNAGGYKTFDSFRRYWVERLASLRGNERQRFNDLRFVVDDFRSEKSAGADEIDGTYTVNVYRDSQEAEKPIASITVQSSFVRGPDRMWYLNQGTLKG